MSYLLVNAKTQDAALLIAYKMKAKLEERMDKPVRVVQDVFPLHNSAKKLKSDLENPATPTSKKLTILMGFRSFILNQEVLPALDNGEIVLHVGGMLNDYRHIPSSKFSLDNLLEKQIEVIQKTGRQRSSSPVGSLYCSQMPHDKPLWNNYRYQIRKLEKSLPHFRTIAHSENVACLNSVISHLL